MNFQITKPELQKIDLLKWKSKSVEVWVLREDLIHPFVSGNKWRKLKYNIAEFRNHLVATAFATRQFGINSIGIVRGEAADNPYLRFIKENDMKLHFISRLDYRSKDD